MDLEKRSTAFGAALIIFAVLLRLVDGALLLPTHASRPEQRPNIRLPGVSISAPTAPVPVPTTVPTTEPVTAPPETQPPQPEGLCFTAADVGYLQLRTATDCGYYPDLMPLLLQDLQWQLDSGQPTVLIYHSHATESYAKQPGQDYTEQAHCRTTDTAYNMVAVGDALAALLMEAGIVVIHDRQLHDYPAYSAAYANSGRSVSEYLAQYPSIRLVLDLHRDAAVGSDGGDYAPTVAMGSELVAQLMIVVGTNYGGGHHPNWQDNLSVALKLQVLLEKQAPGITRQTSLRGSRFNQDLSPGALLIEVGATGNTLEQVYRALPILANAIIALRNGTQ